MSNEFYMKRFIDLFLFTLSVFIFIIPMALITIMVLLTSKGEVLYWSNRVGKNNKIFKMPKFRSMLLDTPDLATHLLANPNDYLSPIGGFLRSTSMDELPQLFSVFKGDMTFVGPRPALFNQDDLITLRTQKSIDKVLPGITGWAQVNGRDGLTINEKVDFDLEYIQQQSFWFDMKILWITIVMVVKRIGISH